MIITAIRHTSVDVPSGICYGISDVPVSGMFAAEVERIRKNLGENEFEVVYSSPLQRCVLLANELSGKSRIITDHRLTELNFGDWEMCSWDFIFESSAGKAWFSDYASVKCPNGESFSDQISRIASFLSDLIAESYPNVLLVVHAGVIRALMCLLQAISPEKAFDTRVDHGQVFNFKLERC